MIVIVGGRCVMWVVCDVGLNLKGNVKKGDFGCEGALCNAGDV